MNILLLAYKYPPFDKVGALRWTNLSAQMALKGHQVHVLTVNWPSSCVGNELLEKLPKENLFIHRIPAKYPIKLFFGQGKNKFHRKVLRKLWNIFPIKKIFYWDDLAQQWGISVIPYAKKIIKKNNIDCLIATGHPFRANHIAVKIKKKCPYVKLVQDFRDPWAQDAIREMSFYKKGVQLNLQRESIRCSDLCVGVTAGLVELMSENGLIGKWNVVANGYSNNFKQPKSRKNINKKIIFTYIGNIRCGRYELFEMFVNSCLKYRDEIKILYIGSHMKEIEKGFQAEINSGLIEVHGFLSQEEAFEYVLKSDWAIQLNSEIYPYLVSTKIYEYAMLNVPTFSINYGGEIEDLIRKADLGISVNLNTDDLDLNIEKIVDSKELKEYRFDISEYSYDKLAEKYLVSLEKLCKGK